jgi:YcxB-like protein
MRVTYCLNAEDYYEASQRGATKRRLETWLARLFFAFVLGVIMTRSPFASASREYVALGLMIVLVVFGTEAFLWLDRCYHRYTIRRAASTLPSKETIVDIEADGIQTAGAADKDAWSSFSNFCESEHTFILYRGNAIVAILPKRAFDGAGLSSCREILKANVAPL